MEIEYKQFVVVPKKPYMSRGKIASQVAHASFVALEKQRGFDGTGAVDVEGGNLVKDWKQSGMCVIVLECPTQQELFGIAKYCEQWGVQHHLYIDEGMTEIPMGTATAFATGIVPKEKQWMFSQLKLFTDKQNLFKRWE